MAAKWDADTGLADADQVDLQEPYMILLIPRICVICVPLRLSFCAIWQKSLCAA
jgi:hypothetical protein